MILVAYDKGSIALGVCIGSSGMVGYMQLTVLVTLHNLHGIKGSINAHAWRFGSRRSPRKPTLAGLPRR